MLNIYGAHLRDFAFCVRQQEKLQGKVDTETEFASTPSGQYSFAKWLWKVPVVVTANYTTKNRSLFETCDFLGNTENRVLVELAASPGQATPDSLYSSQQGA